MSQDHLGLFDTPPDRQEIRLSLLLVGLLFAAVAILSALPDVPLRQVDPFIPMVDAIICLGDMVTATLLFVQSSVFRSRALTILAAGFLFEALVLIAHVLTFPGAFAAGGLLGAKVSTTAWLATIWRAAAPITIILYVLQMRREPAQQPTAERPPGRVAPGVLAATGLAVAATILTTRGHDLLPQLFVDRYQVDYGNLMWVNGAVVALLILALAALFLNRKSVLDTWLLVALSGWLAHSLLNAQATARFTVSFYSQFGLLLFSHFVLMLALIAETDRLYARLAQSVAERNREHEARLMSMDAVAAAIAHEVGQPLTSVILNASAGLSWLTRAKPDCDKAVAALGATIEDGNRAFEVIKSIRAMFAKGPNAAIDLSLNNLLRETAGLLDKEIGASKVSLQLALDESLPPVQANRVQLQRVLINIFTNAIEALTAVKGRPRQIAVRSVPLDRKNVLLEISDTGAGISPDAMAHIFDAFYTTKTTGTGLGLSLCRTIVEEHGGRLWASSAEGRGTTFHLRLPSSGSRLGKTLTAAAG